jgi:hypothetical protein
MEFVTVRCQSVIQKTPAIIVMIFFSSKDGELVYCNDVDGLLQQLGCTHNPEEWKRFVDSSKFSSQIREVISDDLSEHLLTETEKSAWLIFKAVCLNFLVNIKAANCKEFVEDLLNAYQTMGCN